MWFRFKFIFEVVFKSGTGDSKGSGTESALSFGRRFGKFGEREVFNNGALGLIFRGCPLFLGMGGGDS
ncbi:predicted protein [Sclerotinia sclerotiorum 1980 UF-70]|uniref:Uncharacterized protein n=1 Tax=Sclerotinia sclerotiorum (strain ATCC 18683 / 1980 / Ss-1) TaxID=665079 RepID=A7F7B5_SCLS1|nr:predicted protein [Sclerotinia sclerotiorum 1980 UF-70]EDN98636.1 predicted protein [Sclerotinia sclerotiorum 1980 UF-70]